MDSLGKQFRHRSGAVYGQTGLGKQFTPRLGAVY